VPAGAIRIMAVIGMTWDHNLGPGAVANVHGLASDATAYFRS